MEPPDSSSVETISEEAELQDLTSLADSLWAGFGNVYERAEWTRWLQAAAERYLLTLDKVAFEDLRAVFAPSAAAMPRADQVRAMMSACGEPWELDLWEYRFALMRLPTLRSVLKALAPKPNLADLDKWRSIADWMVEHASSTQLSALLPRLTPGKSAPVLESGKEPVPTFEGDMWTIEFGDWLSQRGVSDEQLLAAWSATVHESVPVKELDQERDYRTSASVVREWARSNGLEVSDRGRISQSVFSAYDEATGRV